MDPVSIGIALIAGLWIFDNDYQQDTIIKDQQAQIEQMDKMLLRLAGSHSAAAASSQLRDDDLENKIRQLDNKTDWLDDKIDIMTDPARMVE